MPIILWLLAGALTALVILNGQCVESTPMRFIKPSTSYPRSQSQSQIHVQLLSQTSSSSGRLSQLQNPVPRLLGAYPQQQGTALRMTANDNQDNQPSTDDGSQKKEVSNEFKDFRGVAQVGFKKHHVREQVEI